MRHRCQHFVRTKGGRGEVLAEYSDAGNPLLKYTLVAGDNITVEAKSPVPKK